MKRRIASLMLVLAAAVIPASAARAAGPPQPSCTPSPDGTQCRNNYSGSYTDTSVGVKESVSWQTDVYSGNIESVVSASIQPNYSVCGGTYTVSPALPNPGPVTVRFDYVTPTGLARYIELTIYSGGSYSGAGGPETPIC